MNAEAEREVATKSRRLAHLYAQRGKFGRAFAHLLVVLKLVPDSKCELKSFFTSTLCSWGKLLEVQERYADLFGCYEQAIETYPENEQILNNLGAHLFRLQHYKEARYYFQEALKINCDYLPAYRNLQNVLNCLVDRWHFRMLNDGNRNECYRTAIIKKINQGYDSVLDIGTGTGILSLYAKEANAKYIYACDYSETMLSIAEQVISANSELESFKLINKLSSDLIIPNDIPNRISLVITETMDAGLLGENVLQSVIHAWEHLLEPPNNVLSTSNIRVIPNKAILYMSAIQAVHIAKKSKVFKEVDKKRQFRNSMFDFDIPHIKLSKDPNNPYDTERLNNIPGGYIMLSKPIEVFMFNFNNVSELKEFVDGCKSYTIVSVIVSNSGYLDALSFWFDLILDDDIALSSSPLVDIDSCWDQAVIPFDEHIFVEEGMDILLKLGCRNGKLTAEYLGAKDKQDEVVSMTNNPVNALNNFFNCELPESTISFLNNEQLMSALKNASYYLKAGWSQNMSETMFVLDLSPVPCLGFLISRILNVQVIWLGNTEPESTFNSAIANLNSLPLHIKSKVDLETVLDQYNKLDVIVMNLIERSGEFSDEKLTELQTIQKSCNTIGLFLPSSVTIWCQLVSSEWLLNCYKVRNPALEREYQLSQFINKYKVSQFIDVNLNVVKYHEMSKKCSAATILTSHLSSDETLTFKNYFEINEDGFATGIAYWFEYDIFEDHISTFCNDSHINQAVEMFDNEIQLKKGRNVTFNLMYNFGVIKFKLC